MAYYQLRDAKDNVLAKGFKGLEGLKKAEEEGARMARELRIDVHLYSTEPVEVKRGDFRFLGYQPRTAYMGSLIDD